MGSLLTFIAEESESSRHIQFYLKWTKSLLYSHGSYLKSESKKFTPVLNLLIKGLTRKSDDLSKVCDYNKYTVEYLIAQSERNSEDMPEESDEDMEVDGPVNEVTNQSDSDEDMSGLASKWTDEEEEEENNSQSEGDSD